MLFGGGGQAADAGADDDADFVAIFPVKHEAGIKQRVMRGENAELGEPVGMPDFLRRRKGGCGIEIFHLAGDLRFKRRRIERADAVNAALPGDDVVPKDVGLVSQRRDHTKAGDDHAALR